ncbi:sulfate/molybdate ABC transporter ATP-binding protein [Telmatospirillum sp. J64-1]|uniref:sulfate/molybdate ABC transporter ATP-binding protein n=1 Tax=Telmatospirillum sp. J64-1 TaxID=2502183 RepID=UPI00115F1F84|nr:sulfate/molybdate ABC transporter ATP-binding protein [Telmatospirillum sp. J64-1]
MIDIRNITKAYGDFVALRDVSLDIHDGELVALLGPSGSGKTTLLRIIAGLDFANAGTIRLAGENAAGLSVGERRVGFVFQHFALFRHMTVFDNVAFGLTVRSRDTRPPKAEIREKVEHLLRMVQLEGLAKRYPSQLSGGQRQRVALARALAIEPRVLLLDEPFGALDAKVRKELRRWLRHLHDELKITGVFVTHDQEEALEVADRVVVMDKGKIEQVGTPTEIYDNPASPFVYRFLGNVNSLACNIDAGHVWIGGQKLSLPQADRHVSGAGTAFVRPHELDVVRPGQGQGLSALVRHMVVLGPVVRVELEVNPGEMIEAELTRQRHAELALQSGERVVLVPRQAQVFLTDDRQYRAIDPNLNRPHVIRETGANGG